MARPQLLGDILRDMGVTPENPTGRADAHRQKKLDDAQRLHEIETDARNDARDTMQDAIDDAFDNTHFSDY